jgi:hypothetical protein
MTITNTPVPQAILRLSWKRDTDGRLRMRWVAELNQPPTRDIEVVQIARAAA